jgi:LAO/AO transport system kinase
MPDSSENLASALLNGDRRALARAITLVESTRSDHLQQAARLLQEIAPHTGKAMRLGISGAPGAGKSTFIEAFGSYLIDQGRKVAVLAVDLSSPIAGGSILGDKTRMETLSRRPEAFIRPSPSAGMLGGVAPRTPEAMLLCEAAGYDTILVETVGVGQSETTVASMTDLLILLLLPSGGDELQGLKRGIVEMADVILVNKADGELKTTALQTVDEYRNAVHLPHARGRTWEVPVDACSALHQEGLDRAWQHVQRCREALGKSGELARRRAAHARAWLWEETQRSLMRELQGDPALRERFGEVEQSVVEGRVPPPVAAAKILSALLGRGATGEKNALIGRLNHVALVVPDLKAAADFYRQALRARVSDPLPLPDHGVTTVFVELPNTKIELLEPLGKDSPIAKFLQKNAIGGIHHLCYEVADLEAACKHVAAAGVRILGGGKPKTGAHGKPVVFLHPKDSLGTLIELEQA